MPDVQANPIARDVTARITTELHSDDWGAAIEILGEALEANPDADAEQLWQKVKFGGQRQAHDDSGAIVPRSTQYDRRKAELEPINCFRGLEFDPADDKPTLAAAYITREELEPFARSHFETRIAQMAIKFDDAEIARRLDKPVKIVRRTMTTIANRSGLPLYAGPTLTREHDSTIRACIADGHRLFYVEFAGGWRVVERDSLPIDVSTLEPWCIIDAHFDSEDPETRIWYHDFDRRLDA